MLISVKSKKLKLIIKSFLIPKIFYIFYNSIKIGNIIWNTIFFIFQRICINRYSNIYFKYYIFYLYYYFKKNENTDL